MQGNRIGYASMHVSGYRPSINIVCNVGNKGSNKTLGLFQRKKKKKLVLLFPRWKRVAWHARPSKSFFQPSILSHARKVSWRNIAGLVGATSKDKYRLQWHALCPLLGRERCAIRSRAKFTSTAYEIIVNSSVPVSSRLVSARSCVFLLPLHVTSFSFVRISATGYLLSSLSCLVSRYTAEAGASYRTVSRV